MFRTILVSYDGSDHSKNALATAANVARKYGAVLHLSHTPQVDTPMVVVGPFVSHVEVPPTPEQIAEAGQKVTQEAEDNLKSSGGSFAAIHIGDTSPAVDTLAVADEIEADLIVMGRRGIGSVRALAFGSVSQAVAHRSKCACLTVV
ncbi:MAG: universal stress protein [Boseongicola sp.]|nr:MAG: universal stress protein [Boseongicola sp.]